jgi:hypothetical protein
MQRGEIYVFCSQEIKTIEACEGLEAEILLKIQTNSHQKISVHSLALSESDFVISNKDQVLSQNDTLPLIENIPLNLTVKYRILDPDIPPVFSFKTNLKNYSENSIRFKYGHCEIRSEDIGHAIEKFINITESCQDSILLFFPYGGTVSTAEMYSDSSLTQKEYKFVSFGIMDECSYLTLSKADIGRYFVRYSSCNLSGNFWLIIQ